MKYYKFRKSPTHFCFTTAKECSGQILQKSAEFWYPINSLFDVGLWSDGGLDVPGIAEGGSETLLFCDTKDVDECVMDS